MIVLEDGYVIDNSDGMNFTLKKITTVKSGKNAGAEREIIIGYYSNLSSALKAFLYSKFYDENKDRDISLKEAIKRLDEIAEKVKTAY